MIQGSVMWCPKSCAIEGLTQESSHMIVFSFWLKHSIYLVWLCLLYFQGGFKEWKERAGPTQIEWFNQRRLIYAVDSLSCALQCGSGVTGYGQMTKQCCTTSVLGSFHLVAKGEIKMSDLNFYHRAHKFVKLRGFGVLKICLRKRHAVTVRTQGS